MENREQQSKRIPIDFEAETDTPADQVAKKAESAHVDLTDELNARPQDGKAAGTAQVEKSEQATEQPEQLEQPESENEPLLSFTQEKAAESQNKIHPDLSADEISQMLVDLSDAQERSAKLTEEKKLLYEQLMRRQAEFENFRKRIDRERLETQIRVRADLITELLPVLDNLERALNSGLQSEPVEGVKEGIIAGVRLIHRQFSDVLSGLGLTPIKAIGEPFDPHLHEAVTTEVNSQLPENTVTEELQRGYKLGDRLLRPAMVKVAVRE